MVTFDKCRPVIFNGLALPPQTAEAHVTSGLLKVCREAALSELCQRYGRLRPLRVGVAFALDVVVFFSTPRGRGEGALLVRFHLCSSWPSASHRLGRLSWRGPRRLVFSRCHPMPGRNNSMVNIW